MSSKSALGAVKTKKTRPAKSPAPPSPETSSDAYFRLLTENSLDIISILEPDGTIRYESPSVTRILGHTPEELIGHSCFEFVHPDDLAEVAQAFTRLVQASGMTPVQFRFLRKDGTWCPLEAVGTNLLSNPMINGIVVNCRDDSQRRQVEEMLRESEERYSLAMQGTNDGLWDWNLVTQKVYFSPRWKQMLGYSENEIGDTADEWLSRVHADDISALQASIAGHIEKQTGHYEGEYRILHRDGKYRWMIMRGIAVRADQQGSIYRLVGSQEDVTEKKRIAELLVHDALHDGLTRLPNRTLFIDRLQNCLARARRHDDYIFAVLFLDLDRFKVINDGLGHLMGDLLLAEVATLLGSCVRPEDTVARQGGDEFTILLDGVEDVSSAIRVAQRIQASLTVPFNLGGQEIYTTASIGIALSSSGYHSPEDLVRDADNAMYRAKAMGKARHQVFDSSMHDHAVSVLQLESDLRRAVERQEFIVHYQAIRSLESGEINGYEALVRWQHPQRGLVFPGDFIPAAEETGIIVPIGWWVLREACRQTAEWQKTPEARNVSISVNLSSNQFSQPDLPAQVRRILSETGLSAEHLKLEITETVVIDNPESAGEMLRQLRSLGVKVCLDDFGTGYSSLSYLLRFPIDTLKIDRSFVNGIGTGAENASIVRTIVALAHNMGMDVTAEGVETQLQLDHLQSLKCEHAQGYLFSKPVSAEQAFALMLNPA